jgi:hypothetical protein
VKILTILDIRKPANAISANAGFTHCLASGRKIAKDRHLYNPEGHFYISMATGHPVAVNRGFHN